MSSDGGRRQSVPVGVVIERQEIDNPWQDYTWSPVAVIPGAQPLETEGEWKLLREGDGWVQYHAATLELKIFSGETEGYRRNLSEEQPSVYIVLSPGEEADDPEVMPLLATACPYEAESYTEDSEQIVEGVPMPPEIVAWIQDFVDQYHVDVPFKKRKRKPYDPRKGGFGKPPNQKEPRP